MFKHPFTIPKSLDKVPKEWILRPRNYINILLFKFPELKSQWGLLNRLYDGWWLDG